MTRYLLAAEADQIQDLIFRSSRLREVVGGSQLLSEFCSEGARQLLIARGGSETQLIVNDGGAFRIQFADGEGKDGRQQAVEFGRDLAELYRRCTGGSLTVAEPVKYENDFNRELYQSEFHAASDGARKALRAAKSRGTASPATIAHLPYSAFCASCGAALAVKHTNRHAEDLPNYVCQVCLCKSAAARLSEQQKATGFIGLFRQELRKRLMEDADPPPNNQLNIPPRGDWPEAIEKFDPRRYVAYLKADGNGMGIWFNKCVTEEQLRSFSMALTRILRESLAEPCSGLLKRIAELDNLSDSDKRVLPVLPLILGGDDLLALLPAPWALHFAAEFCRAYETKIEQALRSKEIGLLSEQPVEAGPSPPKIAASVVICKANYPYTLAHERCEQLLAEAKQLARRLELTQGRPVSAVNFAVITGNEVGSAVTDTADDYRATLRPYLASDGAANDVALPIGKLLEHRHALNPLPGKRRAELERLYDVSELSELTDRNESGWCRRLQAVIRRISGPDAERVEAALEDLGGKDRALSGYWRMVVRPAPREQYGEKEFKGHALPDLLAAWDYAWRLDLPRSEYPEQ